MNQFPANDWVMKGFVHNAPPPVHVLVNSSSRGRDACIQPASRWALKSRLPLSSVGYQMFYPRNSFLSASAYRAASEQASRIHTRHSLFLGSRNFESLAFLRGDRTPTGAIRISIMDANAFWSVQVARQCGRAKITINRTPTNGRFDQLKSEAFTSTLPYPIYIPYSSIYFFLVSCVISGRALAAPAFAIITSLEHALLRIPALE